MARPQTMPEFASEWPGFPDPAQAVPLVDIVSLVEAATSLAKGGSHGAPADIEELTNTAKALAPPDTPVGNSANEGAAGNDVDLPPSVAVGDGPLDDIDDLVDIATHLATPGSRPPPDDIDDLIGAAKSLAPPDTPAGGGAHDAAVTEYGVRLGPGAVHAIEPAEHDSGAADWAMSEQGDAVFLITIGIAQAMEAMP